MSEVAVPFTLRVDGIEVFAEETDGRLVLSYALTDDESLVVQLAAYAAGRMLKEDAVLAYGGVGVAANHQAAKPPSRQTFIWQDAPADADDRGLIRLFETFTDSCEWWRARVDALSEGGGAQSTPASEAMVILP
jgi:hypothetical protein